MLPSSRHILEASYFSHPLIHDTAVLLFKFWDQYRNIPSFPLLHQLVEDTLTQEQRGAGVPKGVEDKWRSLLVQLETEDLTDANGVLDMALQWIQDRAFEEAIIQAARAIDTAKRTGRRDYQKAQKEVQEALSIGQTKQVQITDYFEERDARLANLFFENENSYIKIPTLLPAIDQILGGGVDRREEVVWAGPPSRGKTASMVQAAKACLYQRLNVAFFTGEMDKVKIAQRLDRSITRMTKKQILRDGEEARRRLYKAERFKGHLKIINMSGRKQSTVDFIHAELESLRAGRDGDAFIPDAVVVDYPGVMRASRNYDGDGARRQELADIYKELRELAKEWDVVLHTGCQMNRASLNKAVVTIADLAECFEVAAIADVIVGLCQTKDEELAGLMRFFIAKHRDGQDHYSAPFKFDKTRNLFTPAGEAQWVPVGRNTPEEPALQEAS